MREYTIKFLEFEGLYFPTIHSIVVKASSLENALIIACAKIGEDVMEYIDFAKDSINEDDYNVMFRPNSNMYIAIAYNHILDYKQSSYRLLKGYCGKRKCFDIIIRD